MIYTLTTWIIPLLLCMIIHEFAHGYVAMRLGDKTALNAGRLTLNPIPHIDPIGSILFPLLLFMTNSGMLFGWAKPVPINVNCLKNPKRDMGLIAAAGPFSNLLLAIFFVIIWRICSELIPPSSFLFWIRTNIQNGVSLSLVIGIFNLLPLLPLDGGRILMSLLPLKYAIRYQATEKYGFFILISVILLSQVSGIDVIGWFIGTLYPLFGKIVSLFM